MEIGETTGVFDSSVSASVCVVYGKTEVFWYSLRPWPFGEDCRRFRTRRGCRA